MERKKTEDYRLGAMGVSAWGSGLHVGRFRKARSPRPPRPLPPAGILQLISLPDL